MSVSVPVRCSTPFMGKPTIIRPDTPATVARDLTPSLSETSADWVPIRPAPYGAVLSSVFVERVVVASSKHLYSPEAALKFFEETVLSGTFQDAFSAKNHKNLLKELTSHFDFSQEQAFCIQSAVCCLSDGHSLITNINNPNSRVFANKVALLNALYTIEDRCLYPLLPEPEVFMLGDRQVSGFPEFLSAYRNHYYAKALGPYDLVLDGQGLGLADFRDESGGANKSLVSPFLNDSAVLLSELHSLGFAHGAFSLAGVVRSEAALCLQDLRWGIRVGGDRDRFGSVVGASSGFADISQMWGS
jgi:hypothetical protein